MNEQPPNNTLEGAIKAISVVRILCSELGSDGIWNTQTRRREDDDDEEEEDEEEQKDDGDFKIVSDFTPG